MIAVSRDTQRIGFALVRNFALMSYASASEPLRAANLLSGSKLYEVTPLSVHGLSVTSSSAALFDCADLSSQGEQCHTVFVCAGGDPADWSGLEGMQAALRRLARRGVRIGAISSGSYILAAAGLLDNRAFTIHWEHAPLLRETFPRLNPLHARYVIDGDRITCGGGIAPLDMMHALIAERMGLHFARRVSDWYLHTAVAEPEASQRASAAQRHGTHHPALLNAIEKMEASVERPLSRAAMAALCGISPRHLDRLFASEIGQGFRDTYRRIRLDNARKLLEQSPLSISEIAFAAGFCSSSHFARRFSAQFGQSPSALRKKRRPA